MRCSGWARDEFFTVGTLDVFFKIILDKRRLFILIAASTSCTRELLLSAKNFASPLSLNIQDLNVVEVSRLLSDTSTRLLFRTFLYKKDNKTKMLQIISISDRQCNHLRMLLRTQAVYGRSCPSV